jgi:hypothetical protein
MSAYTPGLELSRDLILTKRRELPLTGEVLVKVGDRVQADTPVLAAEIDGELTILRLAEQTGILAEQVKCALKPGDKLKRGDVVFEKRFLFGLFSSQVRSPIDGVVEFFTVANAHLGIRAESSKQVVNAFIEGVVTEVEERKSVSITTRAALMQGIFGVGRERIGEIMFLGEAQSEKIVSSKTVDAIAGDLAGRILIGGASFDISGLAAAAQRGVVGVVTGSIDSQTLSNFIGYEVGVSMTGDEDLPLTLIIMEGFGDNLSLSESVEKLAQEFNGRQASISGATQVRAGALRPEIIIPYPDELNATIGSRATQITIPIKALELDARIRCVRDPYFGSFGRVVALPAQPKIVESGVFIRVLEAKLEDGRIVTVPRANAELV